MLPLELEWLGQKIMAPICLSLEEVAVCAGQKVLMKAEDSSALIIGDSREIWCQQLRPHPIRILNIVIVILIVN